MSLTIISLKDLLSGAPIEDKVKQILHTFESITNYETGEDNDVKFFLHNKAISFENIGLSATYLIFAPYKNEEVLVGYFSIANKPLTIPAKTFNMLSKSLKKRFKNIGFEEGDSHFVVPAFLIGQLGKNFSEEAIKTKSLIGDDIVSFAEEKIKEAMLAVNGKYVWLECIESEKLINFYERNGYRLLENYTSTNGLKIMVKKIN